jgi:hypothetical protein
MSIITSTRTSVSIRVTKSDCWHQIGWEDVRRNGDSFAQSHCAQTRQSEIVNGKGLDFRCYLLYKMSNKYLKFGGRHLRFSSSSLVVHNDYLLPLDYYYYYYVNSYNMYISPMQHTSIEHKINSVIKCNTNKIKCVSSLLNS